MTSGIGIGIGIGRNNARRKTIAFEKGYYVDAIEGNDANDGLAPYKAVKTIAKVNSLVLTGAVRKVFFRRGQSWEGTITVPASGTAENPVVYGAYGTGEKPKIYGSEVISGWTLHSGNIYKATFNTEITQLFANGQKMKIARLTNTGYNTVTAVASNTQFTCNAASQPTNYYAGCKVVLRTQNWYSETRTVTASSGNTLTIDTAPSSNIAVNQGVLIMNKLDFIDSPGEWYYDAAAKLVYFWAPNGGSPAGYEVRGSTLNNGIQIVAKNYVQISNLNILHQKNRGISLTGAANNYISVNNCTFGGQGDYGIWTESTSTFHTYANNDFSDICGKGLYGYHVGNCSIVGNTFSKIGLFSNWGIGINDGTAIEWSTGLSSGINNIRYNKITETGYNGIMWRGETNIEYNYVYGTCLAKSDGAGIYTGSPTSAGSVVRYNIVDYVLGEKAGFTTARNFGFGIYLDENSANITVEYNTVLNCSDANLFLHKPSTHTVRYNTLFAGRYNFRYVNTPTGTSTFNNNLLVTGAGTDDYEPRQLHVYKTTGGVALNNNTFVNGFASSLVFRVDDGSYKNFADWQTATGNDANSVYIGTALATGETQRVLYNNTALEQTWHVNNALATDMNGNAITGTFVLQPYTSLYMRGLYLGEVSQVANSKPLITAFGIPAASQTLDVPVTLAAYDTEGISGYILKETPTTPDVNDTGWVALAPASYTFAIEGTKTLYAWVKDNAGNISESASATVEITLINLLQNIVQWIEGNGISSGTTVVANVGNNGTLIAGPVINQTGALGKAVQFDGTDDYMTIPELSNIFNAGMTNNFSVMCRFKHPVLEASNRIFAVEKATTDFVTIFADNGTLSVNVAENNNRRGKVMTGTMSTNDWYTVVLTWDAATKTVKMYVNGAEQTTANANVVGILLASTTMKIARIQASTVYANILWETLAVFNKVLTQAEVTYLQDKQYAGL